MYLKYQVVGLAFAALSLSSGASNMHIACANDRKTETLTVTFSNSGVRVTQKFHEGHYRYPEGRVIEHEVLYHHYSFPIERRLNRPVTESWNESEFRFERYLVSDLEEPRVADDPRSVLLLRSLLPAPSVEEQRRLFAYRADDLEFVPRVVHINWATNRLWVVPDGESVDTRWHCRRLDR